MLTEQLPNEVLIKWAGDGAIVQHAMDRPWFHAEPPASAPETYQSPCRCRKAVKLQRFPCEDGADYIYIGQCG